MYCTSCGSNLGAWSNKSCPRCGAPLRSTTSTPSTTSTASSGPTTRQPANRNPKAGSAAGKRISHPQTPWLIGAAVFVLAVSGIWWGLGLGDPPPLIEQPPINPPPVDPPPIDPPPIDPPPYVPPPVDPPPVDPPPYVPPPVDPPPIDPPPYVPPSTGAGTPRTGAAHPQEEQPRPTRPPASPTWLPKLRAELSQCSDYSCHKKAQSRYCQNHWNKLPECRSAL